MADQLRAHIEALLPAAKAHTDQMWQGGSCWYSLTARLDAIRRGAKEEHAESRLAAHVQVSLLARDCKWLLGRYSESLAVTGEEVSR
ncbi:DUF6415 family natural product biosynthesis protein [Streptomyces scopuliridis]|uniref:DUF6415 family natural product biosynthesis protein n=1 Tax=Streptomyces scopuliridis TaxID=452529 RepID=UPI0036908FF2